MEAAGHDMRQHGQHSNPLHCTRQRFRQGARLIYGWLGWMMLSCMMGQGNASAQQVVQEFRLRNVDGKFVGLQDFPSAKGFIVIFTCNHCPFAKLYPARLRALSEKYAALGVPLLAISSTDTVQYEIDGFEEMARRSRKDKYNFPYLQDGDQRVAQDFGAQKTPHAYVIWKANDAWVVRYNGAIDDNGGDASAVTQRYVADAVDALLAGKSVATTETKSIGCQIYFRK